MSHLKSGGGAKRNSGHRTKSRAPTPKFGRWWFIAVPAVVSVFLCGLGILAGWLDAYGQPDRAQKAEAIVVLGASVEPDGTPSEPLRERIRHALNLYKKGMANRVIFTGGVGRNPPAESEASAAFAMRQGLPKGAVLTEKASHSTRENARYAAAICRDHHWKRVIVVSDPYHLWRARRDFQAHGLTVYTSPATAWQRRYPVRRMWMSLREAVLVLRDIALSR